MRNLRGLHGTGDLVQSEKFTQVLRVLDKFSARPAVQRGLLAPPAPFTP